MGFNPIPVDSARPLRVQGLEHAPGEYYAPFAMGVPTPVASCSRGCKVFTKCNGLQFRVLREGMSRAPVFFFDCPENELKFADQVPLCSSDSLQMPSPPAALPGYDL